MRLLAPALGGSRLIARESVAGDSGHPRPEVMAAAGQPERVISAAGRQNTRYGGALAESIEMCARLCAGFCDLQSAPAAEMVQHGQEFQGALVEHRRLVGIHETARTDNGDVSRRVTAAEIRHAVARSVG